MASTTSAPLDALIVGGGQAGLAAGYYLQRAGLRFAVLEAGPEPAGSWPLYYESLALFSPARYAGLPGLPFPGAPEHYPRRDEVIAYLTSYAKHFALPVLPNTRVETVEQRDDLFEVVADEGAHSARTVIAATGSFHRPYVPKVPGLATFRGKVLHSSSYRHPDPFRDQRVIVVGGGNSAVQIAVELAQYAHVTLASRRPITFTPQHFLGRDIHFWANLTGLERVPLGRWIPVRETNPVLDTGKYGAAIMHGKPQWRPMFLAFRSDGVVWADGLTESVDAVVFATGFRPNLGYLASLDALAPDGRARQKGGVSVTTSGLYYVGLAAQRTFASATLRGVGADAAYVVERLRHYIRTRRR